MPSSDRYFYSHCVWDVGNTNLIMCCSFYPNFPLLQNSLPQAALYAQAADFNKTARFYYMKAQDAYYLANAQASYDDWRRARRQWDYFYRRK
jgi:hypothetical protein